MRVQVLVQAQRVVQVAEVRVQAVESTTARVVEPRPQVLLARHRARELARVQQARQRLRLGVDAGVGAEQVAVGVVAERLDATPGRGVVFDLAGRIDQRPGAAVQVIEEGQQLPGRHLRQHVVAQHERLVDLTGLEEAVGVVIDALLQDLGITCMTPGSVKQVQHRLAVRGRRDTQAAGAISGS